MKKYLLLRLLKSIISIFIVVAVVIVMVFTLMPEYKIFQSDTNFSKLRGNQREVYRYQTLDSLGYLDYVTVGQMCNIAEIDDASCTENGSEAQEKAIAHMESEGYTVNTLTAADSLRGTKYGVREFGPVELIIKYFARLFRIDTPNTIQDANNPALDDNRGYYFGTDHNGIPALMCSGCRSKYQIYFDGKFPFIHQNILTLYFGNSYPTNPGTPTMDVINDEQGNQVRVETEYPTGHTASSSENLHSATYKYGVDALDQRKFDDNYATLKLNKDAPSMVGTSYVFGIISLILAYLIALPWGVAMARNKGKLVDKIGIFYINLLIAIPSLALIFVLKYLGLIFGLPDKFPQYGFNDIRSFIMPIIVMTIISTPGIMMWIRRYMIDQASSDYVKFAKAKGLSQREISRNHILKNAIIPIVNGIPGSIVLQIGGAIYTETIFAIPGMGKMLPDAINKANNNMIITLTFIFTALSIFALLAGDIMLTWVDPRISLNAKKGDI